jgi:hypothetical protein
MKLIVYSDNNADYELNSFDEFESIVESYLDKIQELNDLANSNKNNHEDDVYIHPIEFKAKLDFDDESTEFPDFIDIDDDISYPDWNMKNIESIFEYKEIYEDMSYGDNEEPYLAYCNNCGNVVSKREFEENYIGEKSDIDDYYANSFLESSSITRGLLSYFDMDRFLEDEESSGSFTEIDGFYFWS